MVRPKNLRQGSLGLIQVIIIDDDRSVRHIVASGLNGYCDIVLVPAADGDIGLDLLESEKPTIKARRMLDEPVAFPMSPSRFAG